MNYIDRCCKRFLLVCLILATILSGREMVNAKKVSTLSISDYSELTTLKEGQAFCIRGIIASNFKLTEVTINITTDKGSMEYSVTTKPNKTKYDISALDSDIRFDLLRAGKYIFQVDAKDASGETKRLLEQKFTVNADSSTSLQLIGVNELVRINKGEDYKVEGLVSSVNTITNVTASIIEGTTGNIKYKKSAVPNTNYYDIAKLDSALHFNQLPVGSYVFQVSAVDSGGGSVTLLNQLFLVVKEPGQVKKGVDQWLENCKRALDYYADKKFSYGTAMPTYVGNVTTNRRTNCAAYVSWCLQRNGFVENLADTNQFAQGTAAFVNQLGWEMNTDMNNIKAGDIVYYNQRNVTEKSRKQSIAWLKNHGPSQATSGKHVDICYNPENKQFLSAGSETYIKTGKIATYNSTYLQKHFICSFRYPE